MFKKIAICSLVVATGFAQGYSCVKDYVSEMKQSFIDVNLSIEKYASSSLQLFKEPATIEYALIERKFADGKEKSFIPFLTVCFQDNQVMMFKPIGVGQYGMPKNSNFSESYGKVFYKAYLSQDPDRYKVIEGKSPKFTIFFGDILFDRQSQIAFNSYIKDAKKNSDTLYYIPTTIGIPSPSHTKFEALFSLAASKIPLQNRLNFFREAIGIGDSLDKKDGAKQFIAFVKGYGVNVITDDELKEEEKRINTEFSYWFHAVAPDIFGVGVVVIYSKFPQKGAK